MPCSSILMIMHIHIPHITNTHKSLCFLLPFSLHLLLRLCPLFPIEIPKLKLYYARTYISWNFFSLPRVGLRLWGSMYKIIVEKGSKRRRNEQCRLIFHFECIFFSFHPSLVGSRPWVGQARYYGWGKRVFVDGYKKDHTQKISCWVFRLRLPISAYFFLFFSPLYSTTSLTLTLCFGATIRRLWVLFWWNMKMSCVMSS